MRSSLVLAFALTLTLHGQPFTPTVNVYRFQTPVVEPEQVSQTSTPQPVSRRRRVLTYAAVGALGACLYGSIEARHFGEPDESGRICKAYAALGAAAGVTLGAMWPER